MTTIPKQLLAQAILFLNLNPKYLIILKSGLDGRRPDICIIRKFIFSFGKSSAGRRVPPSSDITCPQSVACSYRSKTTGMTINAHRSHIVGNMSTTKQPTTVRPLKVEEIVSRAQQFDYSIHTPMVSWLRTADAMQRQVRHHCLCQTISADSYLG